MGIYRAHLNDAASWSRQKPVWLRHNSTQRDNSILYSALMGEPYTFIRALLMRPARSTGAGFAIPENRVATPALVVVSVSVLLLSLTKHASDLDHLHMSWDFLELNLMMSASGAAKQPCSVAASKLHLRRHLESFLFISLMVIQTTATYSY